MFRLSTTAATTTTTLTTLTTLTALAATRSTGRMMATYYSKDHEWVSVNDGTARVGITNFAQDALGDIVFVELPDVDDEVEEGETFAVVDSTKAASDVYAPISGTVTAVNDALEDEPSLVNSSPETDGWMVDMTIEDPAQLEDLMDAPAYAAFCEESK